ncbi:MAG: hypothetical protein PUP92_15235 [Rhizonema sp. PD38]|nr:hypothetical protein [Rhizonema sp. PD38]
MSTLQSVRGILEDFSEQDGIDLSGLDAGERREMKRAIGMANKGLRSDHNQREREYIKSVIAQSIGWKDLEARMARTDEGGTILAFSFIPE